MDERRVADYFVVAGLADDPEELDDTSLTESGHLKSSHSKAPITDIGVIFPSLDEKLPQDYELLKYTPTGLTADLNHGSLRSIECFICYKRGRDKPPLVDIGMCLVCILLCFGLLNACLSTVNYCHNLTLLII